MARSNTSCLVIVILILVILLMGGAGLWYYFHGRIGNRDIYDEVQVQGKQMLQQVDQRSDAIEAKLDRLGAKLDTVHGLSTRTDAQAARIEGKLDKLIQLIEKQRPAQMEPTP